MARYRLAVKAEVEFDVHAASEQEAKKIAGTVVGKTNGEAQYFELDWDASNAAVYIDTDAPIEVSDVDETEEED